MKKKIVFLSCSLLLTLALQFAPEDANKVQEVSKATDVQMNYDPDGFGGIG